MGHGVERYLSPVVRGEVSAALCRPGVRGLVKRGREHERHVEDERLQGIGHASFPRVDTDEHRGTL